LAGSWDTPALTRRRDPDVAQETWRIHFGDVVVGMIGQYVGNPDAAIMPSSYRDTFFNSLPNMFRWRTKARASFVQAP
jgi:hypothetical protein